VQMAWNGTEFVLAWLEPMDGGGWKVRATRIDAALNPIDSQPFDVAAGPAPFTPVAVIGTPTGALIAYTRADDANAGAPRAFMRALDRVAQTPRGRAVGK